MTEVLSPSSLGFAPWGHGRPRSSAPEPERVQVQAYGERTWVLRQSKAVNFEAPFMFVLAGDSRSLLIDTGAVADPHQAPIRETVDALVGLRQPLLVLHTHGHGDHVAGDPQFYDRPGAQLVGPEVGQAYEFFGWGAPPGPGAEGALDAMRAVVDLGGRQVEVRPTPGHDPSSVSFVDSLTNWLLSGDTVYPGRLYVRDLAAFRASLDRLVAWATEREVVHILGCHIEMSNQEGRDYAIGCTFQPDEPQLEMSLEQLVAVRAAAHQVTGEGIYPADDFIIYNGMGMSVVWRPRLRGVVHHLKESVIGH